MAPAEEAAARITRKGVEGDGVNSRLFELLWKRDLLSDSSLALKIPDTVIFKYNAPSVWYFTSVDGTIKRKHKAKVNEEHIAEEFLKRRLPCRIVAYYVKTVLDTDDASRGGALAESGPAPTTIEYFDEARLRDFLFNKQLEKGDGILQKFLEPLEGHNNMIRAQWSPKVCLLERRVNRLSLNDTRYDMYERAVTFEGPDFHSEVTPVRGSSLAAKVQDIAESIVQHVAGVTNDRMRISRLSLNFKVDHKDRMYLLFVSSVRLASSGQMPGQSMSKVPLEANTTLQVPDYIQRAQTISYVEPAVLQRKCKCPTCSDRVHEEMLFDVSYKVMIEYEEQRLRAEKKRSSSVKRLSAIVEQTPEAGSQLEVPDVLQKLHPRLTSKEYLNLRNEVAFLQKRATVCENCYLRFSAAQLGPVHRKSAPELLGGEAAADQQEKGELGAEEAESVSLVGIQGLAPERLALRRDVTRRKIKEKHSTEDAWLDAQVQIQRQATMEKTRAKSCPKLPSWGPGHNGHVMFPPAPVLAPALRLRQPPPPPGAPPPGSELRESGDGMLLIKKKKVAPLRANPYLKEIQGFAANHRSRAGEVLGPAAAAKIAAAWGDVRDTDKTNLPEGHEAAYGAAKETQRSPQNKADDAPEPVDLDADSDGVVSDEASEVDPAIEVAQLWGKWPPSCDSARGLLGGPRSSTPTTRPPSQGDAFSSHPSSHPTSRPSTRPGSQGAKSPAARQQAALERLRAMRPSSSPMVGQAARVGGRPPSGKPHLDRPASSPMLQRGSADSPLRPRSGTSRPSSAFGRPQLRQCYGPQSTPAFKSRFPEA